MRRATVLAYGVLAYLAFLGVLLYTIGFLGGFGVPKGVDDGTTEPGWRAVLINLALLGVFAVQHSVMARPGFKRWWTGFVSPAIERSTYVWAANLVVVLLLWQWRPLPDTVWSVDAEWARIALWVVHASGWGLLVLSTIQIGHFDLFGVRQAVDRARNRRYVEPEFREPFLYRMVRHPLMVGFLVAFWATPDMSVGRLLFAAASTAYILVAVRLEEHDLKSQLGESYEKYMARVPRFVPRPSTR